MVTLAPVRQPMNSAPGSTSAAVLAGDSARWNDATWVSHALDAGWEHYKEDGSAKPGPAAPHVFWKLAL
ncbi:MAG TPA: hypothetical protein VFP84_24600 [Kofleriaceae bacterium]|nr:hypothetical protein [Kofleriaceae bacterium]